MAGALEQAQVKAQGGASQVNQVHQGEAGARAHAGEPLELSPQLSGHQREGVLALYGFQGALVLPSDIVGEGFPVPVQQGETVHLAAQQDAPEGHEGIIAGADLQETVADGLQGDLAAARRAGNAGDGGVAPQVRKGAAVQVHEGGLGAGGAEVQEEIRGHALNVKAGGTWRKARFLISPPR